MVSIEGYKCYHSMLPALCSEHRTCEMHH